MSWMVVDGEAARRLEIKTAATMRDGGAVWVMEALCDCNGVEDIMINLAVRGRNREEKEIGNVEGVRGQGRGGSWLAGGVQRFCSRWLVVIGSWAQARARDVEIGEGAGWRVRGERRQEKMEGGELASFVLHEME
ncbi:hypothetical protein I3760_09G182900 [Carya illinoinensis]|nr:hypothetical protein I3760_09G182900 [Carya illinoinensis]